MGASVHVVARFLAQPGKEQALKSVLIALVPPTRQELGCYQSDLLQNPLDPCDFCFVERWENDRSVDRHVETAHVQTAMNGAASLVAVPPDVRRYHIL